MPEGPLALLGRPVHPVVVELVLELGELVRNVELEVGRGGVDEHDVQIQVQQMRHRTEHHAGDVVERIEQEVHRPIRLVVGERA